MHQASDMIVIYTTFALEQEARQLGAELVGRKLAACINIFPQVTSIYHWQGAVEQAQEVVMLIKTRRGLQDQALAHLQDRHPYSVPALYVLEPAHVSPSYLQWLVGETQPQEEVVKNHA